MSTITAISWVGGFVAVVGDLPNVQIDHQGVCIYASKSARDFHGGEVEIIPLRRDRAACHRPPPGESSRADFAPYLVYMSTMNFRG